MDQGGSGREEEEEEEEEQEQERKKTGGFQRKLLIACLLPPSSMQLEEALQQLSQVSSPLCICHRLSGGGWGREAYLPDLYRTSTPLLPAPSYCLHFSNCSCSALLSAVPA